jgi:hypothetical protein
VSLKATPVRVVPRFGLVIVKVSVLTPPTASGLGENALAMLGGATAVKVAVPVLPVPPLVEVTALVVLTLAPEVVAVTLTLTVQVPLAAIVPPEKLNEVFPAVGAKVGDPQHVVATLGVAATCNPAGNESLKATPVKAVPALGLVIVKVSVLSPPTGIELGEKSFAMLGGASTVNVSVPVLPVPPLVEVTFPVVFTFAPLVVAVTTTETVQVPLAAMVPPEKLKDVFPAAGVKVAEPQPVEVAFGVAATCSPAGKVSLKATPVSAVPAFGLVIVKVNVLTPPTAIRLGANALARFGGASTVKVSVPVLPVPPFVALTWPVVLTLAPAVVPVTLTATVQVPLAAMVPPEKLTDVLPAAGVNVGEPQPVVETFGIADTCRPAGNESVKPTPVRAVPAFGFVIVNVSVLTPPTAITLGEKVLAILGAASTVKVSVPVLPVPPLVEVTLPVVLTFAPGVVAVIATEAVHVPFAAIVPPEKLTEVLPAAGAKAGEPQPLVLAFGVAAICNPAGNESLKATPVSAVPAFALVIVKVSVLTPPTAIGLGEKVLAILGAASTVNVSVPLFPVPPFVEVMLPVVLTLVPAAVAVTATETEQVLLAATVPPEKLKDVFPAAGAKVGAPQPVVEAFGVAATCRPAGNESVNATPVRAVPAFALVIVNVIVLTPPTGIEFGENALAMFGGASTVNVSVPVLPVPPLVEVTAPVVLTLAPLLVAVTLTLTVHVPLAPIVPPEKVNDVLPAVGAKVGEPQPEVELFGVAATCNPAGNESLKAMPVKAVPAFGLVSVNVNVLTPPTAIGLGENAFAIFGAASTVNVSVPVFPVPPLVEVTLLVVLSLAPLLVAVTLTLTVQVPLAAMVPPEKLNEVFPAVGAKVGDPQPVVATLGVAATCRPAGNESLKLTPVSAVPAFALVSVKVNVLTPPTATEFGEKALAILGGASTVNVSVPVFPVPPFVEVTFPVVFTFAPLLVAVTATETVQVPLAATVPPEKVNEAFPPAGANVGEPQPVVDMFGVAATWSPAGNESVNATPLSAVPAFGLVIVKVKVLTPPTAIGLGENALAMLGAASTVKVSVPVLPVPPLVEVTLPVVLSLAPLVVAVTLTLTVHVPLAAIVPPEKLNDVLPAAGANVGEPQPVVVAFGVAATWRPAGKVSVKATPVRAVAAFGLVTVKVNVLTAPTAIKLGEKAFARFGAASTVNVSVPVFPVPPFVEVTLPVVFTLLPLVVAVTATETVQVPLAAMVPPEKLSDVFPAAGMKVGEPQPEVEAFGVAATCKPAGNASVKATPVRAVPAFGFVMVNVSVLSPLTAIALGEKAFVRFGGASTVSVSVPVLPVPPFVEVTFPVVFTLAPLVLAVTATETVQVPLAAIVAPEKLNDVFPAAGANVGAPQPVVLTLGVAATCRPAGNASVTPTPVSAVPVFGLVSVNVMVLTPPTGIEMGANALAILGGASTVKVSLPVFPVPPLVELTLPVVLTLLPLVVPVTLTATVHVPLAAMVPPEKLTDVLPAAGVKVGEPQPVAEAFGVAATSRPAGNESVKARPVSAVPAFGFVIVKVNVLIPPTAIGFGENAFPILGAESTVKVSVPVFPVPPLVEVTLPVVLTFGPAVVAVTLTLTVQVPLAATEPPEKLSEVLPAAGAKVGEPQPEVEAFGVAATSRPAGNASVKATPVSAVPAFEFVIVKVSVLTPPTAIGLGENALAILGAASTVKVSVPVFPVPPLVEATLPVVLSLAPLVVAVTLTVTVHVPLAAMVPAEKLTDVFPIAGAKVGAPQPVVETFGVVATSRPAGKVSVKATPVSAVPALGLVIVKVKVLTPPTAIGFGENAFAMLGGEMPPASGTVLESVLEVIPSAVAEARLVTWPATTSPAVTV